MLTLSDNQAYKMDEGHCPQCTTPIIEIPETQKPPRFCLNCRLPLFTIEGRYRLLRKIGEGGMGRVFLAEHTQRKGNPPRVLKFLSNDEGPQQATAYKRFVQEIHLTVQLSQKSPHIVKAYNDYGYAKGLGTFYVMEYVEGVELGDWIAHRHEEKTIPEIVKLFRQLLSAVHVMHEEGVLHRDIKPQNIMIVTEDGCPPFLKLTDFGAARQLTGERLTKSVSTLIGTPLYMAPEQFVSSRTDKSADIYSLGLILYEMLAGRHPFAMSLGGTTNRMMEAASAHLYHEPPPLRSYCEEFAYPEELEELVMKALHKDPQQRIASVAAFEDALSAFEFSGRPILELTQEPIRMDSGSSFTELSELSVEERSSGSFEKWSELYTDERVTSTELPVSAEYQKFELTDSVEVQVEASTQVITESLKVELSPSIQISEDTSFEILEESETEFEVIPSMDMLPSVDSDATQHTDENLSEHVNECELSEGELEAIQSTARHVWLIFGVLCLACVLGYLWLM